MKISVAIINPTALYIRSDEMSATVFAGNSCIEWAVANRKALGEDVRYHRHVVDYGFSDRFSEALWIAVEAILGGEVGATPTIGLVAGLYDNILEQIRWADFRTFDLDKNLDKIDGVDDWDVTGHAEADYELMKSAVLSALEKQKKGGSSVN